MIQQTFESRFSLPVGRSVLLGAKENGVTLFKAIRGRT